LRSDKLINGTSSRWMRKLKLLECPWLVHGKARAKPILNKRLLLLNPDCCTPSGTSCQITSFLLPVKSQTFPVSTNLKQIFLHSNCNFFHTISAMKKLAEDSENVTTWRQN
jgi:hypothetical protein